MTKEIKRLRDGPHWVLIPLTLLLGVGPKNQHEGEGREQRAALGALGPWEIIVSCTQLSPVQQGLLV
jgi:hypothetical protein